MTTTPDGQEPTATPAPAPEADIARLAVLERELKEARAEAAKYRTEKRAQEAQAAAEREQQLAAQGEYKTLAEQRAAALAEAEQQIAAGRETSKALERYQQAVAALVAPRLEGLSEPLQALVRGLEPLAQLEWLAALAAPPLAPTHAPAPLAPPLAPTNAPATRGTPTRPPGGWTLTDIYKR